MTSLTDFLFPAPAPRRVSSIIAWWEERRLAYNLILGGTVLLTLGVVNLAMWVAPGPFRWVPWQPVVIYGVLANFCYLLGPALEVAIEKLWGGRVLPTGPGLFRMGLTFAVGLTLLPILVVMIGLVARIIFF